jgi:hypothetical protein
MKRIILSTVISLLAHAVANAQCASSQIPYIQNFETAAVPFMPECTSANMGTFIGNNWETAVMQTNGTANTVLRFNTETDETEFLMADFYTNFVNLQAGVPYKISFKYGNLNPDGIITNFSASLTHSSGQMAPIVSMENLSENGEFATGPFSVNTTGIYYLNFNIMTGNNQGVLFVDDIAIEEWGCVAPEGLTVTNITDTGAQLNWTDNDAPNFEYVIVPAGETPEFGVGNTTASVAVTELEPATEYTAYVRGYCFDSWSIWSPGVNFTTTGLAGLSDNELTGVSVFPNPVKNVANISYSETIDKIELFNALGQMVHTQSYQAQQAIVNIESLATGTYFMTIYSGQKIARHKILKE